MQHSRRPHKVAVEVFEPGRIGGTPCSEVTHIHAGFDWNAGTVLITTAEKLTRLSEEEVADIRKSVSLGQSWHAYQAHKRSTELHDKRIQWLADEGAMIKSLATQHGLRYTIYWTYSKEEMAEFFHTPKQAIDAAMRLNNERSADDPGQQLPDLPA